jgi:WD40 repeat protein
MVNLKGHTGRTTALAFSSDRTLLASSAQDGTGRIWEFASKKPGERSVIRKECDSFASLVFSPNNRQLALGSGSLNGNIWVLDVTEKNAQEVAVLRGAKGAITALAFSHDGKLVAGGGEDHTLRIWEPVAGGTGTPRTMLKGHTSTIRSLAFAPSNAEIATASIDNSVKTWTLSRIRSTEKAAIPHPAEVNAVLYTPDGKTLITGSQDKIIRLWDLESIKPKLKLELKGHRGGIRLLWLTPDGRMLVSISEGPQVMNWEIPSGKVLNEWQVPAVTTAAFAVTVDGRYFANGTSSGNVDVHRVAEKRA